VLRVNGLPGLQVIVGFSWSSTVTSCEHDALLPAASFTIHVIVVTPLLNEYPVIEFIPADGEFPVVAPLKDHVLIVTPQLSNEPGSGTLIVLLHDPVAVFSVISAPQVIVGTVLSNTVTVKVHVDEFPVTSVNV
jgi:hypothetical protein